MQDILMLTPTDEMLLAECQLRATMLGMTWQEVMMSWLRDHPIPDDQLVTHGCRVIHCVMDRVTMVSGRMGSKTVLGNGVQRMEMMFTKASIAMVNGKAVVAARMPMVLNTTAHLLVVSPRTLQIPRPLRYG